MLQKRYDLAIEEYKEALKLNMNVESIYNLALSYERIGGLEEALKNYRLFVEVAPQEEYGEQIEVVKERIKSFTERR